MKKVFIIGTLFCTLLMTGCGCGKKEEIKKLECTLIGDGEEKIQINNYFQNNYLKKQEVNVSIEFPSEESAQIYYDDLTAYGETLELQGKFVYSNDYFEYSAENDDYLFEIIRKKYIDAGYECK